MWDGKFALPRRREHFYSRSDREIEPLDHIRLLDDFDKLVPYMCSENDIPVLRHPDLHLFNVFVNPIDLEVTSIRDWQGTRGLPYTIQSGYPRFFSNDGKGLSRVRDLDRLPDNLDSLEPDEKESLPIAHTERLSCQLYVLTNAKYNRPHFDMLSQKVNSLRAEVVSRAGLPWNGDLVAFQNAVLDIIDNWERFSTDQLCPLEYSADEVATWREEYGEWAESYDSLLAFRADLGINEEGWVPSEKYEETAQRNRWLRREVTASAEPEERREIWRIWPFKDTEDMSEWHELVCKGEMTL